MDEICGLLFSWRTILDLSCWPCLGDDTLLSCKLSIVFLFVDVEKCFDIRIIQRREREREIERERERGRERE